MNRDNFIDFAILYLVVMSLATCIARGQGWIPDVRDTVHDQASVDTTEAPEPDTAMACLRSPAGAGSEVRLKGGGP